MKIHAILVCAVPFISLLFFSCQSTSEIKFLKEENAELKAALERVTENANMNAEEARKAVEQAMASSENHNETQKLSEETKVMLRICEQKALESQRQAEANAEEARKAQMIADKNAEEAVRSMEEAVKNAELAMKASTEAKENEERAFSAQALAEENAEKWLETKSKLAELEKQLKECRGN